MSGPILSYQIKGSIKLQCKIDLDKLLPTESERIRFKNKWEDFLASDPSNKKIFRVRKHKLQYESEQLIPKKKDKRPALLLVLGNPASHSVHAGMFFAFEGAGKERRFWKKHSICILGDAHATMRFFKIENMRNEIITRPLFSFLEEDSMVGS